MKRNGLRFSLACLLTLSALPLLTLTGCEKKEGTPSPVPVVPAPKPEAAATPPAAIDSSPPPVIPATPPATETPAEQKK